MNISKDILWAAGIVFILSMFIKLSLIDSFILGLVIAWVYPYIVNKDKD